MFRHNYHPGDGICRDLGEDNDPPPMVINGDLDHMILITPDWPPRSDFDLAYYRIMHQGIVRNRDVLLKGLYRKFKPQHGGMIEI